METKDLPEHCQKCWKVVDGTGCDQAENMHANTQPVPGFAWQADTWCEDCLPSDTQGEDPSPLDWGESDTPEHCSACGAPLVFGGLTSEGIDYVRAAVAAGDGCCRLLWPALFAGVLSGDDDDDEREE